MLGLFFRIGRAATVIMRRLLDPHRYVDYAIAMIFATLPIGACALAGTLRNRDGFIGYLSARNWVSLILVLPVVLWILRWIASTLDPVDDETPPINLADQKKPPIVKLFDVERQAPAQKELHDTFFSPLNFLAAFLVMLVLQATDFAEVGGLYLRRFVHPSKLSLNDIREQDWSVMRILDGHLGPVLTNLGATLVAYSVQFAVGLLAFLILIILLRHNLYFLYRIYQRRRAEQNPKRPYIIVNWDHRDGRFGFGEANHAFNCEVRILALAGVLLLASRFHNVPAQLSQQFYEALPVLLKLLKLDFDHLDELADMSKTVPDVGQWILVLSWLVLLAVISIPALVKFLPFGAKDGLDMDRTAYLKEFQPEDRWPGDAAIDDTAKKFAKNSFWPTGDSRALWLFGVAMTVFFVLAFPLRPVPDKTPQFLACYVIFFALGFGAAALVFRLLRAALSYVHESLVESGGKKD